VDKLDLILATIPDKELIQKLEKDRGPSGVDKYPIRALWNSLIAGVVYEHDTIESLRKELKRNPLLRRKCGFNVFHGVKAVPSSGSYSRFVNKLLNYQGEVRKIYQSLLKSCFEKFDGFGRKLGIDGKALSRFAIKRGNTPGDRRGDHDANWGKHVTRREGSDGKIHEKVKTWFAYTLHLIADTRYELPVSFTLLPASHSEIPVAHKLIDGMSQRNPEILRRCEYLNGDRGYNDTKLHIKPIIDIRQNWKDGEATRAFGDTDGVVYDNKRKGVLHLPQVCRSENHAMQG